MRPTHHRRHDLWLDHPGFSRRHLGQGVYGAEYDERLTSMETGSKDLLRALWHSHKPIMLHAEAKGRSVVRL